MTSKAHSKIQKVTFSNVSYHLYWCLMQIMVLLGQRSGFRGSNPWPVT